jgi:epoxide hydrolase-like predicted phosphatase
MKISAVIWDMGGVLVRTEDFSARQSLADRLKLTRIDLEELVFSGESGSRAQLGEISPDEHWENVRRIAGLEVDGMEEFQRLFWDGDRVDYELVDYIRRLRGRYKTALLSNAFSNLRMYLNSVWKFEDAFDVIVISAEVGLVKPHAPIYRLALEKLGVEPEEAVFIDDFSENIEGARLAGLNAIQFRDAGQARAELEKLLDGSDG